MWKKKKWLFIVPVLILSTGVYIAYSALNDNDAVLIYGGEIDEDDEKGDENLGEHESSGSEGETETGADTDSISGRIYVDVGGAVAAPQVVVLEEGARIYEAIAAAGGTLSDAETKYMNMAALCEDGAKIYVPSSAEIAEQKNSGESNGLFSTGSGSLSSQHSSGGVPSSAAYSGKVNINTADAAQLQTLSGIGPSMAQRIIDYRNSNGKFTSADDLKNVSVIGYKTLSKIIEIICV